MTDKVNNGIDSLMMAASRGDQDEVRRLITTPANLNAQDSFGNTALIYASIGGHAEIVELLLGKGADPAIKNSLGLDCLTAAAERGHQQVISILRAAKLLLLIRDGELVRVSELLDAGVDINAQITHGWTPLMVAALENQVGIIALLLERGADLGAQNSNGLTAEMIAGHEGHSQIVELLQAQRLVARPANESADVETNILDLPPITEAVNDTNVVN